MAMMGGRFALTKSTLTASLQRYQQPRQRYNGAPWPASGSRSSSHSPLGSPTAPARKKVTIHDLQRMYEAGEPIAMMTAHDFPSAHVAEQAGMDMILVGDSLAMVALGMADTGELELDEMLAHCRAVARAAPAAFTVGDLPLGSYEVSAEQALASALRLLKHGRMQAVKLEGGGAVMAATVARIAAVGVPVVGHVGLTPQRQHRLGGFRVQARSAAQAKQVLDDALALQHAGAFAVVLEAVPEPVAALITKRLRIPTIGIGAGSACSGQVLVQLDMLGAFPPGRRLPKFVKQYGNVWAESMAALTHYRADVKSGAYPAAQHTYPMDADALDQFKALIGED